MMYTIKPIEWQDTINSYVSTNSIKLFYIVPSEVNLGTCNLYMETFCIAKYISLDEAKQLAEKEHVELIKQYLNEV